MNYSLKALGTLAAFATLGSAQLAAQEVEYTGIADTTPIAVDLGRPNVKYDGWYNFSASPQGKVIDGVNYSYDFDDQVNQPGLSGLSGYPTAFSSAQAYPNPVRSQLHSATGYALSTPAYAPTYDASAPASSRAAFNKVANGNGSGGLNKFNADGTRNTTAWGGSGFGPMPSGGSLYGISFSNNFNARGGTLGVFEASPLDSLDTISLQIQLGSANGYDFYEPLVSGIAGGAAASAENPDGLAFGTATSRPLGELVDFQSWSPVLHLTFGDGSTGTFTADIGEVLAIGTNGTIPMPTGPDGELVDEDIIINLYGFTWDLSAITGEVASFIITWDVVEHSQMYAVRLDQGAIPEPSTYAMLLGAFSLGFIVWRRRRA